MAVIGILFALAVFLAFSGLNSAVLRVANAYATRIENAVVALEEVTLQITSLKASTAATTATLVDHERRITDIEKAHRK